MRAITFTVRPHPKKRGYTLIPSAPVSYLPQGRMGWYKYKRDALARANELNKG